MLDFSGWCGSHSFSGGVLSGCFVKSGVPNERVRIFGIGAYTSAMARRLSVSLCLSFVGFLPAVAQRSSSEFPSQLLIARHTFFDFGPPFDFYEVITVDGRPDGLDVERALLTPAGDVCFQPPVVELKTASMLVSMSELLKGKN